MIIQIRIKIIIMYHFHQNLVISSSLFFKMEAILANNIMNFGVFWRQIFLV